MGYLSVVVRLDFYQANEIAITFRALPHWFRCRILKICYTQLAASLPLHRYVCVKVDRWINVILIFQVKQLNIKRLTVLTTQQYYSMNLGTNIFDVSTIMLYFLCVVCVHALVTLVPFSLY